MIRLALAPQIHGQARITFRPEQSVPLLVETESARWAFAASFGVPPLAELNAAGRLRAVVDIEVDSGAVGLGCTGADYLSYIDREVTVVGGARQKVYVPLGALPTASRLVMRNVSPLGCSRAKVYGIEVRQVDEAEEVAEFLRTSRPIGDVTLHGECSVQPIGPQVAPPGFQPLRIETDVEVYSNAASFALTVSLESDDMVAPWLIVDLEVDAGAVWVGCTTMDYSSYVDREVFVPAGSRGKAYVPLGAHGSAFHVMFRNDNLDGRSVFRIYGIAIRSVTPEENTEAHLRSLDPLCLDVPYDGTVAQGFGSLTRRAQTFEPSANDPGTIETPNTGRTSARYIHVEVTEIEAAERIGGMATMPSRAKTFELALASILPQIDRLYLYLDKRAEIPRDLNKHPKIIPLLPSTCGEWGASGKLIGSLLHAQSCFYFCFDDDILYPPDYVEAMTHALYRHDLQAVVGVHACRFKPPYLSFRRDRDVVEFRKPLAADCCWDILGTGTIAFHTDVFKFDPSTWRYNDMADLMIAIEAAKRGLPRIAIRRPKNYLRPLDRQQPDSIYVRLANDDTRETTIMRQALRSSSLSWSFSPIALRDELAAGQQGSQDGLIDTIHGVVAGRNNARLTHTGLVDTERFVKHLRDRPSPYVPLDAALRGEGDAFTIDDSTAAGRDAALLARAQGHAVTMFLNGYNISERIPYHFSRLSAAIDSTKLLGASYEGYDHDLQTSTGKQRFRWAVKRRLDQLGADPDRQAFVSGIGDLLGLNEIIIPSWLQPITPKDVRELFAEGVTIHNHGWTHAVVGSLDPDEYAANIQRGRTWLQDVCGAPADCFAVPNGDALPLWSQSANYCAWLMLDPRRPNGELAPGVFNRRMLPT